MSTAKYTGTTRCILDRPEKAELDGFGTADEERRLYDDARLLKARRRELRIATETRVAQSAELMAKSAHSLARSTEQIAKSSFAVYQSRELIERLHKEQDLGCGLYQRQ